LVNPEVAAHAFSSILTRAPPGTRVVHLDDLAPVPAPTTNPDLEEPVLNANVVLRWEYRLGATLFVVFTRSQSPTLLLGVGERPTLDLGAALRGPAADVFLVKLSFWTS